MNERIQKLTALANQKALTDIARTDIEVDSTEFNTIMLEKFAELLVRECDYLIQQQVSLKYKDGWEQCGLSDDWASGHYGASILSRTVIKQHFGVDNE